MIRPVPADLAHARRAWARHHALVEASLADLWAASAARRPRSRAGRVREDSPGATEAVDFGSPAQPPRPVRASFVSCNPPIPAVAAITGPDPVGTIQRANTRAIALLDFVINELQAARRRIVAGTRPAFRADDRLLTALRCRFGLNANDRRIWTGRDSRSIDVLIRRFRGARQILADGWMAYTCFGLAAPATVTLDRGGRRCTVQCCVNTGDSQDVAFTCGGNSRIVLCNRFWKDRAGRDRDLDFQAGTLLHEALHIYFTGTIGDAGVFGNANCYEQFVFDLNRPDDPLQANPSCAFQDRSCAAAGGG